MIYDKDKNLEENLDSLFNRPSVNLDDVDSFILPGPRGEAPRCVEGEVRYNVELRTNIFRDKNRVKDFLEFVTNNDCRILKAMYLTYFQTIEFGLVKEVEKGIEEERKVARVEHRLEDFEKRVVLLKRVTQVYKGKYITYGTVFLNRELETVLKSKIVRMAGKAKQTGAEVLSKMSDYHNQLNDLQEVFCQYSPSKDRLLNIHLFMYLVYCRFIGIKVYAVLMFTEYDLLDGDKNGLGLTIDYITEEEIPRMKKIMKKYRKAKKNQLKNIIYQQVQILDNELDFDSILNSNYVSSKKAKGVTGKEVGDKLDDDIDGSLY